MLKENKTKIDWDYLSVNTNPYAIELLKANRNKINWPFLSENQAAIELLKDNEDKIDWALLSSNPNDEAIELLNANQDKIDWKHLSLNPNPEAIELLKANQKKIYWDELSRNTNALNRYRADTYIQYDTYRYMKFCMLYISGYTFLYVSCMCMYDGYIRRLKRSYIQHTCKIHTIYQSICPVSCMYLMFWGVCMCMYVYI